MRIDYVHYCCQPTPQLQTYYLRAVIQRVMLASRKVSSELNVLHDVIKVINHKVHALSSHQFERLCEEMDAEQIRQVHWLSKGRSLDRVFEL